MSTRTTRLTELREPRRRQLTADELDRARGGLIFDGSEFWGGTTPSPTTSTSNNDHDY